MAMCSTIYRNLEGWEGKGREWRHKLGMLAADKYLGSSLAYQPLPLASRPPDSPPPAVHKRVYISVRSGGQREARIEHIRE
jgi:hypothetical protein